MALAKKKPEMINQQVGWCGGCGHGIIQRLIAECTSGGCYGADGFCSSIFRGIGCSENCKHHPWSANAGADSSDGGIVH